MDSLLTIKEASALIASRAMSPLELLDQCLARVELHEDTIHAFVTLTPDRARSEARAATRRAARRDLRGPLDGIPIGHKDIFLTAGIRTTACSRTLQDFVPRDDAVGVKRLAAAGAVMLGKLTTHEFALGGPSLDLPWPPARNPWDPARFTGGSSSGPAAAVAAGFVLGATGSDTIGSIRGPAALSGVAGLKPTFGLCSMQGVVTLAPSLDHVGPLCWTAADCAAMLAVMKEDTAASRPFASAASTKSLRGLKIGRWLDPAVRESLSAGVLSGIESAAATLAGLGAQVRELGLPPLEDFAACAQVILAREAFAEHRVRLQGNAAGYTRRLRDRLCMGAMVDQTAYELASEEGKRLSAAVAEAMAETDIVLTASHTAEAPLIDDVDPSRFLDNPNVALPFNLTGQPAIAVRSGQGASGLPVSVQLVARSGEDDLLIHVATAYERAAPWTDVRPLPQPAGTASAAAKVSPRRPA